MSELKTFGELSLQDTIYYLDADGSVGTLVFDNISGEDNDRFKTKVSNNVSKEDFVFPNDETTFFDEETGVKYTLDKSVYRDWCKPIIQKQINELRVKMNSMCDEIEELEKPIIIKVL